MLQVVCCQDVRVVDGHTISDKTPLNMAQEEVSPSSAIPQFSPADFDLMCAIGIGFNNATVVYLARHLNSGQPVVIRRSNVDELTDSQMTELMWEAQSSHWLSHVNISPFLASFVVGPEIWTVGSLLHYGSCADIIRAGFPYGLPEIVIAFVLRDCLSALEYIHHNGYIHRSVTPRHLLVGSDGHCQLGGQRTMISLLKEGKRETKAHHMLSAVTAFPWLAPEVFEQNLVGYDYKSDIYSVGISAIELAHGVTPYADMTTTQMLLLKLTADPPTLVEPQHGPQRFSSHFHQFVNTCLQRNVSRRPNASKLLQHSFFKQIRRKDHSLVLEMLLPVCPINPDAQARSGDAGPTALSGIGEFCSPLTEYWDFN